MLFTINENLFKVSEGYILTNDEKIEKGDWYLSAEGIYLVYKSIVLRPELEAITMKGCKKIIASSFQLGGIPLVLFEKEDSVIEMFRIVKSNLLEKGFDINSNTILSINKTIEDYKVFKSTYQYTTKDISDAFYAGAKFTKDWKNNPSNNEYTQFVDDKKIILTIEVEDEQYFTTGWVPSYNDPDNSGGHPPSEIDYRPKVTMSIVHTAGEIIVKNIKYKA
jgi:hypothetical protein